MRQKTRKRNTYGGNCQVIRFPEAERAEELVLKADAKLSEEVYERFVQGTLSLERLETVYSTLREWSELSERILRLLDDS